MSATSTQLDFKLLFESAPQLFLVLRPDPAFTILGASDAYLCATLTERERIVGRGLFEVFPDDPDDAQASGPSNLRGSLERVLAGKCPDPMAVQKYDIRRPAGEGDGFEARFWSPLNSPVLTASGEIAYIIHRVEDVTDFVRRGEAMETELEAFSYSVSHDLRAPLRAIDGFGKLLLADHAQAMNEQARHYLERVLAGTQQMSRLIEDLLELSRITRGPLRAEPVDLTALAQGILAGLSRREPARTLSVDVAEGLTAQGDVHLLTIVLENLLGNAWKFTAQRADASIAFGRDVEVGEKAFYVRDNGAGFDMAYAGKLFAPFQRFHRESEFEGAGIGLATVQRILARHGGRIWADAAVGRGATFFFTVGGIR